MTLLAIDLSNVGSAVATTAVQQAKLQLQQMLALIAPLSSSSPAELEAACTFRRNTRPLGTRWDDLAVFGELLELLPQDKVNFHALQPGCLRHLRLQSKAYEAV